MLKNKRGEGYVKVCVLVIVICMILSVFVTFASAVNVVRLTERNSKTVLESYLMKNSIEIYNSIKQGNNDADALNASMYISDLAEFKERLNGCNCAIICTWNDKRLHGIHFYAVFNDGGTLTSLNRFCNNDNAIPFSPDVLKENRFITGYLF